MMGEEREGTTHGIHSCLLKGKQRQTWHGNANKSPIATKVFLVTLRNSIEDGGSEGKVRNTTPIIACLLPFLSEYMRMCKQHCGMCAIIIRCGIMLSSFPSQSKLTPLCDLHNA